MTVVWMARARRDAEAIHAYIAQDDPIQAHTTLVTSYQSVNRLADFPGLMVMITASTPSLKASSREVLIPRGDCPVAVLTVAGQSLAAAQPGVVDNQNRRPPGSG